MFFRQLLYEDAACISYCVGCPSKGVVAIIDPQTDIEQYLSISKQHNLKITHIIETHVQADHLSGAHMLSRASSAPVYYHRDAQVTFSHRNLEDGEILQIGNRKIRIIHTPGHTNDSMTLLVDDWFILTGDTLFVGDVGRVDLSLEDDPKEVPKKAGRLYDSLFHKLLALPDYIEVYPGHFSGSSCGKNMDGKPISTIGREKRNNHVLQICSRDRFITMMMQHISPPLNYKKIKRVNMGLAR